MIGETLGGRYKILARIGGGGMGVVYEARHVNTSRRVAVKIITEKGLASREHRARFEVEARAAGVIESEHVTQVFDMDLDPDRGQPYIAMELLEGEDLSRILKRVGALPQDLALRIAAQCCEGLAKAHAEGILHRDIKPGNVFLANKDGGRRVVKLLDFGIAKMRGEQGGLTSDGGDHAITRTGALLGSPLYMSPEQSKSTKSVDARTDVWSVGVVLYQMLVGHAPHEGAESVGDLIVRLSMDQTTLHDAAPHMPTEIAEIVDRALRIKPDERFGTIQEMLDAIRPLLNEGRDLHESMILPRDEVDGAGGVSTDAATISAKSSPTGRDLSPATELDGTQSTSSASIGGSAPGNRRWIAAGFVLVAGIAGLAIALRGGDAESSPDAAPEVRDVSSDPDSSPAAEGPDVAPAADEPNGSDPTASAKPVATPAETTPIPTPSVPPTSASPPVPAPPWPTAPPTHVPSAPPPPAPPSPPPSSSDKPYDPLSEM